MFDNHYIRKKEKDNIIIIDYILIKNIIVNSLIKTSISTKMKNFIKQLKHD